ncbi:MFS transporter [Streptomyces sp. BK79]|uniref:MFS transporter n=1 Tax=Streptomyces sp. BK79 TaxID=3350097 RepID=UPI00376F6870
MTSRADETSHEAAPPAPAVAVAPSTPVHRDGNILRWLIAYTFSVVGDAAYFVALGWAAQKVAGPAQVGLVMAVGAIPRAILMLGGGVIADRFGPRRVVISSDAVRAVVILAAAATLAFSTPGLWLLVALALVFGIVDALFMPAVGAMPPRLTGRDQLMRVQSLRNLVQRSGHIAGPPLAGFSMGLGGPAAAFAATGALFTLSLLLLVAVRLAPLPPGEQPAADSTARRDLVDGIVYLRHQPVVGPLVLSGLLSMIGCIPPMAIGVIMLAEERGWGPSGGAWVNAALSAGVCTTSLLLVVRGRFPRAGHWHNITLLVASAGIGLIGVMPNLALAVAVALLSGLVSGLCGGLSLALMQANTALAFQGRVASVQALSAVGITPVMFPLFGLLVEGWGAGPTFLLFGCISMLGATVSTASHAVRHADLDFTKTAD